MATRFMMPPPVDVIIALVLLSAFLHATWNALLRLEKDKDQSLVVAIAVATLFAATVAGIRWALGAVPFASLGGFGFTLLAGVLEAIYMATLARAMERSKLGVVYTISRGGAVLAVWPLSIVLFSELATLPSVAGSLLVLAGLALSGLGAGGNGPDNQRGSEDLAPGGALADQPGHPGRKQHRRVAQRQHEARAAGRERLHQDQERTTAHQAHQDEPRPPTAHQHAQLATADLTETGDVDRR